MRLGQGKDGEKKVSFSNIPSDNKDHVSTQKTLHIREVKESS